MQDQGIFLSKLVGLNGVFPSYYFPFTSMAVLRAAKQMYLERTFTTMTGQKGGSMGIPLYMGFLVKIPQYINCRLLSLSIPASHPISPSTPSCTPTTWAVLRDLSMNMGQLTPSFPHWRHVYGQAEVLFLARYIYYAVRNCTICLTMYISDGETYRITSCAKCKPRDLACIETGRLGRVTAVRITGSVSILRRLSYKNVSQCPLYWFKKGRPIQSKPL